MRCDKPKRVLIGANDLSLGGVQRLVIDQCRALVAGGFEVHLAILMRFPGNETFDNEIPAAVMVHRFAFRGLADIRQWSLVIRMLKEVRPAVVKTATFFSNSIFLLLRPLFRYQVIAAEHNTVNKKPLWQRGVDMVLYRTAYTIVADSHMVVDFVSRTEHIPRRRFTVLYNGVDLKRISESEVVYAKSALDIRTTLGISHDAPVVLTVARLVRQKDHPIMVEAFAKLLVAVPNARLIIVGEGKMRPVIEERARALGVTDQVILTGEQKDVHRFYSIADVFVLTSLHEGFCVAAMEALAFGIPVVSTRVAGVVEYLEDGRCGFFTSHDASDIAAKLQSALTLSPEMMSSFSARAREVASEYSLVRYEQQFLQIVKAASEA